MSHDATQQRQGDESRGGLRQTHASDFSLPHTYVTPTRSLDPPAIDHTTRASLFVSKAWLLLTWLKATFLARRTYQSSGGWREAEVVAQGLRRTLGRGSGCLREKPWRRAQHSPQDTYVVFHIHIHSTMPFAITTCAARVRCERALSFRFPSPLLLVLIRVHM